MPKKTKKEGYIFDVPKNDPSLALEDDDYFEEEEEEEEREEEIKGVPKGFNFENLHGDDDDDEEEMLKQLLDKEYNLNEKRNSKSKQKRQSKKAKAVDDDEEDDDVLLGLKDSLDRDDFDENEGIEDDDDDDDEETKEKENNEMEEDEEEEEEGLSFDTLSALDNALSIEKSKQKSLKIEERLRKISETIDSSSSSGTIPSDAPSYPHAKRVGNYRLVSTKRASTSLSDRGPSSDIQKFLTARFYGKNTERMPAHVVVKNGAHSKESFGTKYKVKASNLKVQRLHANAKGKLTPRQAGIENPNVHRRFYPKRR